MTIIFKARYSIIYSFLFVSIVCQSFAATSSNLKRTQSGDPQIAESDDPHEVMKKALSASRSVKSYRRRIEAPSVTKSAIIMEYAGPGNARMFEKNEEKNWTSKNEELIWIGKSAYHKKRDGTWVKYPERNSDVSETRPPATRLESLLKSLAKADEIKFIGQETVDGIPTLVYQHIFRFNTPTKTESFTINTWIGAADGLLRRLGPEHTVLGSTKAQVFQTYYDYNTDIKIEPPTEYVSVNTPSQGGIAMLQNPLIAGRVIDPSIGSGFNTGGGPPTISRGTSNEHPATGVDQRPIALNSPRPRYTEEARENRVQGIVLARVLIGADGAVKKVTITRGLPFGLNEQAIRSVFKLRFKPAMKDGQPVAFLQTVQVEFNLK